MSRTVVEVSPGPSLPTTFSAQISQPSKPTPTTMPPVALVEIETAAELIPGPRGSLWYTGTGAPSSFVGQQDGDMYLDNATDHVWQLQSGVWVDTGTVIHGSPDTPADILAKLVTVDGPGSGLDADTLDGQHATFFASQAALDAETAARVGADNTLQTNITAEASTRAGEDAALAAQIATKVDAGAQDTRDDAQDAAIASKIGEAPNDGQQYARKNLAWASIVIPPSGIPEAPTDGQQYARQSAAWAAVAIPPGTIMQDTPPASPQPGQFWYDTDSGGLYLWFNDGSSSQWIQVNGTGLTAQPLRQSFVPSGTSINIAVPTGAKMAKVSAQLFTNGAAQMGLRLSIDGSTFPAGASAYAYSGQHMVTGSSGSPIKVATSTGGVILLTANAYADAPSSWAPVMLDGHIILSKVGSAAQYFTSFFSGWTYHSAATAASQHTLNTGYTGDAVFTTATEIKAIQFVNIAASAGVFQPQSLISVDWSY